MTWRLITLTNDMTFNRAEEVLLKAGYRWGGLGRPNKGVIESCTYLCVEKTHKGIIYYGFGKSPVSHVAYEDYFGGENIDNISEDN